MNDTTDAARLARLLDDLQQDQNNPDPGMTRAPRYYLIREKEFVSPAWGDTGDLYFTDPDGAIYTVQEAIDQAGVLGHECPEDWEDDDAWEDPERLMIRDIQAYTDLYEVRGHWEYRTRDDLLFLTREAADREIKIRPIRDAHSYSMNVWHSPDLEHLLTLLCQLDLERTRFAFKDQEASQ